jgi:hypothetical protein
MAIALFEGGEKVYEEIDKKLTPDIELSETAS